jgi:hypothetical protein
MVLQTKVKQAEDEAEGDAEQAAVDQRGVLDALAKGIEAVDADHHADADHGARPAVDGVVAVDESRT